MLVVERLKKVYPGNILGLATISLAVSLGESLVITGSSRSGKSCLLKLLGAQEKPSSGTILLNGTSILDLPQKQLPFFRRKLGIISQTPLLQKGASVHENLSLPFLISNTQARMKEKINILLKKLGLLHCATSSVESLTMSERQRTCIARAIVTEPALLLADEPETYLESAWKQTVSTLFNELAWQLQTIVLIATRDPFGFAASSTNILYLNNTSQATGIPSSKCALSEPNR